MELVAFKTLTRELIERYRSKQDARDQDNRGSVLGDKAEPTHYLNPPQESKLSYKRVNHK